MTREIWYRYVDNRYVSFDDDGDFTGASRANIDCREYVVVKRTPKGVWLTPEPVRDWSERKFVLNTSRKKFAYPTKEGAWGSFKIRKQRQLQILKSQHDRIAAVLSLIEQKEKERAGQQTAACMSYEGMEQCVEAGLLTRDEMEAKL